MDEGLSHRGHCIHASGGTDWMATPNYLSQIMNAHEAEEALKPPCPNVTQLTESSHQLRESVEAVEMENKRLSKENDRLREELEKSKEQSALWKIENESRAILIGKYHKIIGYDNSDGFHSEPSPEQMLISLKTALAAAKEELETAKLQMDPFEHVFEFIDNALARIAECEKGTA